MKIAFDELAHAEFDDAVEYYEQQASGLGDAFRDEVKQGLKIVKQFPGIGSVVRDDIRKFILRRFPYKILYSIESDYLYIIAIAHNHRDPEYWRMRAKR